MSFDAAIMNFTVSRLGYTFYDVQTEVGAGLEVSGITSGDVASVDVDGVYITYRFGWWGSAYRSPVRGSYGINDTLDSLPNIKSITVDAMSGLDVWTGDFTVGSNVIHFFSEGTLVSSADNFVRLKVTFSESFFTTGNDTVNYNALTAEQITRLETAGLAAAYEGLSGNDYVVLPNIAEYSISTKIKWDANGTFRAGSGQDTIIGGDGNDRIHGGNGIDQLFGSTGNDAFADDPLDVITGRFGGHIDGGEGDDSITFTRPISKIVDAGGVVVWVPGNSAIAAAPGADVRVFFEGITVAGEATGVVTVTNAERINEMKFVGPAVWIEDSTRTESDGLGEMIFKVRLSHASAGPVSVDVTTIAGSAKSGEDFVNLNPLRVTFPPGETVQLIPIIVQPDTVVEGIETFSVTLSNVSGASLGRATAKGTIKDNDTKPPAITSQLPTGDGMKQTENDGTYYRAETPSYHLNPDGSYTTSNGTTLYGRRTDGLFGPLTNADLIPVLATESLVGMAAALKLATSSTVSATATAANAALAAIGQSAQFGSLISNYVSDQWQTTERMLDLAISENGTEAEMDLLWQDITQRHNQLLFDAAAGNFVDQTRTIVDGMQQSIHHSDISLSMSLAFREQPEVQFASGHSDAFMGSDSRDRIRLGDGRDLAWGANGDDYLDGQDGADRLYGDDGADVLVGGAGNDRLHGGRGNDLLIGGIGSNRIVGADGDDIIRLTGGTDVIDGGAGTDTLELNGTAADYRVLSANSRTIIIGNNGSAEATLVERVRFASGGERSWADFLAQGKAFDGLSYIASYADLRQAVGLDGSSGIQHLLNFGLAEGRVASFNALAYVAANSDLRVAFGTDEAAATRHFITTGANEGRTASFDGLTYIASHTDLIRAFGTDSNAGLRHFILSGAAEGRGTNFDGFGYLAANPNVLRVLGPDLQAAAAHYITTGAAAGLTTVFDALRYTASYSDLIPSLGLNEIAATRHFVQWGMNEGRAPSFNALAYTASHTDLRSAFGVDELAATRHFITAESKEGRAVTFDGLNYVASHGDLIRVYGTNEAGAARHFIQYGAAEGRNVSFNPLAYAAANSDLAAAYGSDQDALARHYIEWGFGEGRPTSPTARPIVAVNMKPTMLPSATYYDDPMVQSSFIYSAELEGTG